MVHSARTVAVAVDCFCTEPHYRTEAEKCNDTSPFCVLRSSRPISGLFARHSSFAIRRFPFVLGVPRSSFLVSASHSSFADSRSPYPFLIQKTEVLGH